jgi:orotate phosphoribosyltransferase
LERYSFPLKSDIEGKNAQNPVAKIHQRWHFDIKGFSQKGSAMASTSLSRIELAKEIHNVAQLTGQFLLRSGQTSNIYFDKYRFESQPRLLQAIAEQMLPLIPKGTEVLAGLEMGGIPIATALSLASGLPALFVRKKAKEYGTCKFAEGMESVKGKKLCIIEDVVTTGGQVRLSTDDLRGEGAIIEHVMCVICRDDTSHTKLAEKDLQLHPLFRMDELI